MAGPIQGQRDVLYIVLSSAPDPSYAGQAHALVDPQCDKLWAADFLSTVFTVADLSAACTSHSERSDRGRSETTPPCVSIHTGYRAVHSWASPLSRAYPMQFATRPTDRAVTEYDQVPAVETFPSDNRMVFHRESFDHL